LLFGFAQNFADNVMGLPEWNTFVDQVIRSLGGQQDRIEAAARRRSALNFEVVNAPVATASMSATWSCVENSASLSSCKSR